MHSSVVARRQSANLSERSCEVCAVSITEIGRNIGDRRITLLEHAFRSVDANVLQQFHVGQILLVKTALQGSNRETEGGSGVLNLRAAGQ